MTRLAAILVVLFSSTALADAPRAKPPAKPPVPKVGDIFVIGNGDVPVRVVLELAGLKVGTPLDYKAIQLGQQKLRNTNLFKNQPDITVILNEDQGDYRDIIISVGPHPDPAIPVLPADKKPR